MYAPVLNRFERAAVSQPTRIVIDTTDSFLHFYHHFYKVYEQFLTQDKQEYKDELMSVYESIVFIVMSSMDLNFATLRDRVLADLNLTHHSFFDVMSENPQIIHRYNEIAVQIAMSIYLRLYQVGYLSDKNVYVVDHLYPSYCVLTLYPID
jgi:hypothetical protein